LLGTKKFRNKNNGKEKLSFNVLEKIIEMDVVLWVNDFGIIFRGLMEFSVVALNF